MDLEGANLLVVLVGLVIAVIGMIANGVVVAAISGDNVMRNNSMYLLLANLVSSAAFETFWWEMALLTMLQSPVFQAVADLLYLCASVATTAFVGYNGVYLRAFGSYILQLAIFASICTNLSVCIERYAWAPKCVQHMAGFTIRGALIE